MSLPAAAEKLLDVLLYKVGQDVGFYGISGKITAIVITPEEIKYEVCYNREDTLQKCDVHEWEMQPKSSVGFNK